MLVEADPDGYPLINIQSGERQAHGGRAITRDPEAALHGLLPATSEVWLAQLILNFFAIGYFIQEPTRRHGIAGKRPSR